MVGLRLQSLVPVNFCSRPSAPPVTQLRPPPSVPLCPGSSLVAWLRRRFRPWGPTDMAAATTAFSFSFASSSSSALLRPGLAPLRRWRALTGPAPRAACSASSSPCSADSDEATVISGTKLANQVLQEVQRDVESWISVGNKRPHLTVVLVGDNPASHIYVRNKIKAAAAVGISSEIIVRPKDISEEELLDLTVQLNKDSRVSGLLVQLPLPDHIDERRVCNAIAPEKDVDGFHIMNIGRLCLDQPSIIPATAAAVWEIIKRTGIPTFGKNVVVAGRSKNVGMPISMLLHTDGEHERPGGDATVTITHRYTPKEQLKIHTQLADIVIVAAGVPKLITTDMVKEGAAVIDVGINHIHDPLTGKTKLVGDVDFEEVKKKAGFITPVPGGVGPMTVAMLLKNTLLVAKKLIY
ncbi:probable bifunctional methylenetetrahydrofolate dehydrogenase/cyclohydrolase 2 isoform X3 [Pipra filicauda]|uniref:methenyltetrahydrofolate cyclohydrolase n=2 Tax=Pipridae TaxID=114313 RepID=A0A7R5KRI0_9PASS|nr:probable bifunctional methylenetetrahydrofolate dehydrogenase/cyclohydrolase 2 isoform X3 [Pipra filicauda]